MPPAEPDRAGALRLCVDAGTAWAAADAVRHGALVGSILHLSASESASSSFTLDVSAYLVSMVDEPRCAMELRRDVRGGLARRKSLAQTQGTDGGGGGLVARMKAKRKSLSSSVSGTSLASLAELLGGSDASPRSNTAGPSSPMRELPLRIVLEAPDEASRMAWYDALSVVAKPSSRPPSRMSSSTSLPTFNLPLAFDKLAFDKLKVRRPSPLASPTSDVPTLIPSPSSGRLAFLDEQPPSPRHYANPPDTVPRWISDVRQASMDAARPATADGIRPRRSMTSLRSASPASSILSVSTGALGAYWSPRNRGAGSEDSGRRVRPSTSTSSLASTASRSNTSGSVSSSTGATSVSRLSSFEFRAVDAPVQGTGPLLEHIVEPAQLLGLVTPRTASPSPSPVPTLSSPSSMATSPYASSISTDDGLSPRPRLSGLAARVPSRRQTTLLLTPATPATPSSVDSVSRSTFELADKPGTHGLGLDADCPVEWSDRGRRESECTVRAFGR